MAGFVGRWLSDALRIGLPLALALGAMQVPALAHGYAAALLQIAEDARRDIEQRKAAARQFDRMVGGSRRQFQHACRIAAHLACRGAGQELAFVGKIAVSEGDVVIAGGGVDPLVLRLGTGRLGRYRQNQTVSCDFFAFCSLRMIILRFSREIWSMNRTPFR